MQYINEKDWKEFQEKFPDAYNFLIAKDLKGEYKYLENEHLKYLHDKNRLNEWQKNRYEELNKHFEEERKIT